MAKIKKESILTIEKELLNSYTEAIADFKNIKESIKKTEELRVISLKSILDQIDEIINKHVDKVKSSEIWN